ncbi:MAG: hypothetical protein KDA77_21345, partial [Planctomycetaceae bacterium]|nr:hypothetical protein [Planctomycetaceae bacterium]
MLQADRKQQIIQPMEYFKRGVNGDGVVDETDWTIISDALAVHDEYDVNGDGLVNYKDENALRDAVRYDQIQAAPGEILKGDINGNGTIDAEDAVALRETLEKAFAADLDFDGEIDYQKDMAAFDKAQEFSDLGGSISGEQFLKADVNNDGVIDLADRNILADMTRQFATADGARNYYDFNNDGKVNEQDLARLEQIFFGDSLKLSEDEKLLGNINRDQTTDAKDRELYDLLYQNNQRLNLNNDSAINQGDVNYLTSLMSYMQSLGVPDPGEFNRADVDGQNGITAADQTMLDNLLNNILRTPSGEFRDITGDGALDNRDLIRQAEIKEFQEYGLSDEVVDDNKWDINHDGKIDDQDLIALRSAIQNQIAHDVNADGAVDQADVDLLDQMIDHQRTGYRINSEDYVNADVNGDGTFDQADVTEYGDLLPSYVDV